MYRENLALDNIYTLKPNQTKSYVFNVYVLKGFDIK